MAKGPHAKARDGVYVFTNRGECRSCGATIEWWITPLPKGKAMPLDLDTTKPDPEEGDTIAQSEFHLAVKPRVHWETCPNADQHRAAAASGSAKPTSAGGTVRQQIERFVKEATPENRVGAVQTIRILRTFLDGLERQVR